MPRIFTSPFAFIAYIAIGTMTVAGGVIIGNHMVQEAPRASAQNQLDRCLRHHRDLALKGVYEEPFCAQTYIDTIYP